MSKTTSYESARLRRVRQVTHGLTLDLFLRSGDFWIQVADFRAYLRINNRVTREIPPRLGFPNNWRDQILHDPPHLVETQLESAEREHRLEFINYFCQQQHGRFGRVPMQFTQAFISGCVAYDPPDDDLNGFANHADEMLASWMPEAFAQLDPPPGLPVTWVRESVSRDGERKYDLITPSSPGTRRADVWRVPFKDTRHDANTRQYDALVGKSDMELFLPVIEVLQDTSATDVREAFRWIRRLLPSTDSATKSLLDPLLCVQCAIWRDRHDWSELDIARHFGWAIQHPAGAKPRSETARKYISDGRSLLFQ